MENQLKVAVELHEGEKSTKKIWRFNADLAAEYTKIQMEKEIECLFPHIQKKGLKLKLYHCDELAGKVYIDSDADAVEALRNFTEESLNERRPMYMILHAEDVIVLSSPTMTPATQSAACTSDLNPRKVPNNTTIIITLFSLYSVLSFVTNFYG